MMRASSRTARSPRPLVSLPGLLAAGLHGLRLVAISSFSILWWRRWGRAHIFIASQLAIAVFIEGLEDRGCVLDRVRGDHAVGVVPYQRLDDQGNRGASMRRPGRVAARCIRWRGRGLLGIGAAR